jgi:hypothetical protein
MAKYLHTIDGQAATFDGYQICYATFFGTPNDLCSSLKQIKKEQKISKANRLKDGFHLDSDYGYLRYV